MSVYEVCIDEQLGQEVGIPLADLGVPRDTIAQVGGALTAHRGEIVAPEEAAG